MEILSTSTDTFVHYFLLSLLVLAAIFFLVITVYGVVDSIKWSGFDINTVGALFCTITLGSFFAFASVVGYNVGPTTKYKATVSDFNEVYNNGYKIVDQDGEIYILEKVNK